MFFCKWMLVIVIFCSWQLGAECSSSTASTTSSSTASSTPEYLANIGGTLFFEADDIIHSRELWKSDGTVTGTIMVKDISPSASSSPAHITDVNGTAFFVATDDSNDRELWKSDGTELGTMRVKDIYPGGNSEPRHLYNVNGLLLFVADDGSHGRELWKSDGSEGGTVMVKDISALGEGLEPISDSGAAVLGSELFFAADDGLSGDELWKSDGSEGGTVMVKDISPYDGSDIRQITTAGSLVFFSADDDSAFDDNDLWVSDGTAIGTVKLKIDPYDDFEPRELTAVNGILYFTSEDGTWRRQLWRSDGTLPGTFMVKDTQHADLQKLTTVGARLFFVTGRTDLWRSDGTEASTVLLREFSDQLEQLTDVGGTLFFCVRDELWQSDGTEAGTVMVKEFDSEAKQLTDVNGSLFFRASMLAYGWELWKSDGTEDGTLMIKDIAVPMYPYVAIDFGNLGVHSYTNDNTRNLAFAAWKKPRPVSLAQATGNHRKLPDFVPTGVDMQLPAGGNFPAFVPVPGIVEDDNVQTTSRSGYTQIHPNNAKALAYADLEQDDQPELIAGYSGEGLYLHHQDGSKDLIHYLAPELITAVDLFGDGKDEVAMTFTNFRLLIYEYEACEGGEFREIYSRTPTAMAAFAPYGNGEELLVLAIPDYGLYSWAGDGYWTKYHSELPSYFTRIDLQGNSRESLIVNFPQFGLYLFSDSTWTLLHQSVPTHFSRVDLNGDGKDELAVSFNETGTPRGLYIYEQGVGWSQLHSLIPSTFINSDLNRDGFQELVVAFEGLGLYVYDLASGWTLIHTQIPENLATWVK